MLPQASGMAIARTPRMTGAFHGAMPSTTPTGWRTANAVTPGLSDGMISPRDLRRHRRRLAQHRRRERDVEAAPGFGRAGLLGHRRRRSRAPRRSSRVGRGGEARARARSGRAPTRRGRRRPRRRPRPGVGDAGRGGARRDLAGDRIEAFENAPSAAGRSRSLISNATSLKGRLSLRPTPRRSAVVSLVTPRLRGLTRSSKPRPGPRHNGRFSLSLVLFWTA